MNQWEFFALCLVLAIIADLFFMYLLKQHRKNNPLQKKHFDFSITKIKNSFLDNIQRIFVNSFRHKESALQTAVPKEEKPPKKSIKKRAVTLCARFLLILKKGLSNDLSLTKLNKKHLLFIFELLILLGFALFVGRPYLNMDPELFITGGEFSFATISHSVWNLLPKCGTCVFWNGLINGGSPSFVELHGAFLHPLVILTTLFWNMVNGSKILLLICFFMAGFGQWWLAKELNVGFVGRLWSGLLAITGGHLFGRLEAGNVVLVLSIASASLLIPMIIRFKKNPSNRNIVIFAVLFSLTWLAGQGYIQLVVVISFLPIFLWYLLKKPASYVQQWKPFIKTIILSAALSAILIIPVFHFSGNIDKVNNPTFEDLQPIEYNLLNLVIHDLGFYHIDTLGKNLISYIHINYIGWIPILFTALALLFIHNSKYKKELIMLYVITILVFIFSSKEIYILFREVPFIPQLRSIGVTASLAVQPILGIAAYSLNKIIKKQWGNINLEVSSDDFRIKTISLKWLILIGLLFFSIQSVYKFSRNFISVHPVLIPIEEIRLLNTDSAQWIQGMNSDWAYVLITQYKKVILTERPWFWKNRPRVSPYLEIRHNPSQEVLPESILQQGMVDLLSYPDTVYAAVKNQENLSPCKAKSLGGKIDVWCDTSEEGVLLVREYYWKGWQVWIDGEFIKFVSGDWLSVKAPAGKHLYQFRYRPWDVYAGMGLSLFGVGWCVRLWRRKNDAFENYAE